MRTDVGLLVLRLGFGGLLLSHGIPKLLGFSQMSSTFPDPLHVGSMFSLILTIFGEVVCPALVVAGFATRLAAIPPAITMLVAAAVIHAADPWSKKEMAVLYLVGFMAIALMGPGRLSLDQMRTNRH